LVYELFRLNAKLLEEQKKVLPAFLINEIYQKTKNERLIKAKLTDETKNKMNEFIKEITDENLKS
jgi:RNA-binding protein YhbY